MNKFYKVIKNNNGQMIATSELGKNGGKSKTITVLATAILMLTSPASFANTNILGTNTGENPLLLAIIVMQLQFLVLLVVLHLWQLVMI